MINKTRKTYNIKHARKTYNINGKVSCSATKLYDTTKISLVNYYHPLAATLAFHVSFYAV